MWDAEPMLAKRIFRCFIPTMSGCHVASCPFRVLYIDPSSGPESGIFLPEWIQCVIVRYVGIGKNGGSRISVITNRCGFLRIPKVILQIQFIRERAEATMPPHVVYFLVNRLWK